MKKNNKKLIIKIIILVIIFIFFTEIVLFLIINDNSDNYNCGNNICEYRENVNCPKDCPSGKEPICGDRVCDDGETCQIDCGGIIEEFCGDLICQNSEDKYSCPNDCGLPIPVCGDGNCIIFTYPDGNKIDEFTVCPQDCGIICGDGECVIQPYDEKQNCPQDCNINIVCGNGICQDGESKLSCPEDCKDDVNNQKLIYELNQKQRPLVAGIKTEHQRDSGSAFCSLGMIVKSGERDYLLTAGHCVTQGEDGMPDSVDIGLWVKQGGETIGSVYKIDNTGGVDAALVSLTTNNIYAYKDYLGNTIDGWGSVVKGLKVYKIGSTTGYTTGTITDTNIYYTDKNGELIRGFKVTGDNGKFSDSGDSGAAIITINKPHKLVGVISAGDGSNLPEDIKTKLSID